MSEHAATLTVSFPQAVRPRREQPSHQSRVPRVARLLVLAHQIDARVRCGEYEDLADAARKLGLTRARVTQLVNLTLLAPAIQEKVLALPSVTVGRDPITERTLRPIVAEPVWERQVEMWKRFCGANPVRPESPPCARAQLRA